MDTHGYLHENNTHNWDFVKAKMIEHELNDVWRTKNPFEINYTFMKKQARNTTKARLDFLLASQKTMVSIFRVNRTQINNFRRKLYLFDQKSDHGIFRIIFEKTWFSDNLGGLYYNVSHQ